jgi:hypothetical protein
MNRPEALNGFRHYKTCRCGGSLQYRYEKIEDVSCKYWIYPTKQQVRIFKHNRTAGTYPLSKLQEKLTEHEII